MKMISGFSIGLYLSAEIVKHHGGRIWVESEKGKGATFFFNLPEKYNNRLLASAFKKFLPFCNTLFQY